MKRFVTLLCCLAAPLALAQADAAPATATPAPTSAPGTGASAAPEMAAAPTAPSAAVAPAPAETPAATASVSPAAATGACARWRDGALPEGPIALGFGDADFSTGRRVCPRTEAGLGGRFGAIIDTPNFYGDLGVNGLVFGSWAVSDKLEAFATLEAVNFTFVQNSALKKTELSLGHLTAGATYGVYATDALRGAVSARLLLPTSFGIPNVRLVGAEVGHAISLRPSTLIEVHGYAGAEVTAGLGAGPSQPRVFAVLLGGAQLTPTSWFALVVDVAGRAGPVTSLAPSAALRFRIAKLGIELGGTLPVLGSDRHDFLAALRLSWRIW